MTARPAVFYPFSNFLELGSGNGLRSSLLVRYLAERSERVTTLSPATRAAEARDGVVHHRQVAAPRWRQEVDKWQLRVTRLVHGTDAAFARSVMSRFDEPGLLRGFDAAAEATLHEANVAFVEYPFWTTAVSRTSRRLGIPLVLSLYDIHGQAHTAGTEAATRIAERELDAIRLADAVFCASADDQAYLSARGIAARLAINPIDVENARPATASAARALRDRYGLGTGRVCMFVGSRILPNVEAAAALARLAPGFPDCTFVIAGRCAPAGRQGNVVRMGWVSSSDLDALYAAADLVVMPLSSGTGTSLKFVEAMAYGKAIVATAVAARGYEPLHEVHAHIVPSEQDIAGAIRRVLDDEGYRTALGRGARTLAIRYDFRTVFEPYSAWLRPDRHP